MHKKKASKKRKNKSLRKHLIISLFITAILAGGLYYIREVEKQESYAHSLITNNEPYKLLENFDTIRNIACIELNTNTNILNLSEDFYKEKIFWPYIFQHNSKIENPLDIPKGTVVAIPRIDSEFLDTNSTENINRVKSLGDSILNVIQESLKHKIFD